MADQRGETILRNLVHDYMTESETEEFRQILHQFKDTKSVATLVQQLGHLINTKEKLIILVELSTVLPRALQADFHRLCSLHFKHYNAYMRVYSNGNAVNNNPRVIAQDPSGKFKIVSRGSEKKFMVNYNNFKNGEISSQHGTSVTSGVYSEHDDLSIKRMEDVEPSHQKRQNEYFWSSRYGPTESTNSYHHYQGQHEQAIKRVFLARREDGSLGLGIQGGKEFGTDICISVVEENGPAANQGVRVGDKILEVNGTEFHNMTHAEAVTIIRNAWNVIMMLEPNYQILRNSNKSSDRMYSTRISNIPVQVLDLDFVVYPENGRRMGCSTNRRNRNKVLSVKSVDSDSPAEKAGLEEGDFIIKIDGIDVRNLTEKQITSLTHAKRLTLSVKRVVCTDDIKSTSHLQTQRETRSSNVSSEDHGSKSLPAPLPHHCEDLSDQERFKLAFGLSDAQGMDFGDDDDIDDNVVDSSKEVGNWVLSHKDQQAIKYFQKREFITAPDVNVSTVAPTRIRSDSVGALQYDRRVRADSIGMAQFQRRGRSQGRDSNAVQVVWGGGVRRYVRSRSQSPHILRQRRPSRKEDQDVMLAVQMGMEKRQRALRLSLYQSPNTSDLDWEM